ncbi:hydroxymethylglutaryl-CoA lyase [Halalkalibacter krulwichiae]|uniref:Hydroxymethylglutaryl-CoA lyase YngG n=1 Tax=Halalkalibacter krulwichiae TaxID=199441 RepID=A0A1X9MLA2_9BACI|nr:hydroxymethylglutaryl-CoA lyase [Halalkalibacter krulwichiae]ARK32591.1 Hydroxymethylglutaryl-CoA lyase YngG [Halalkalibacter krulwichiae]
MGLPKRVSILEVGPREGFQMQETPIPTEDKVSFINALNKTGVSSIEVTSFVSPKWVPQMADAEDVLAKIERVQDVTYRAAYLNMRGLERALANDVTVVGSLVLSASNTFSMKNMNKTIDDMVETLPGWIEAYQKAGVPVKQMGLMAAFGCNYEGYIYLDHLINMIDRVSRLAEQHGEKIQKVRLADTMGWANPEQMKRTIFAIKNKWPELEIGLHLHDTRGLGLTNAYAALQEGVYEFDAAVAGLGGCPFAAVKGAPGNICTEDLAFMCEEQGIETGIDLDALLECAKLAQQIVGDELPGHLIKGGRLYSKRPHTWMKQQGSKH